jgi:HK97 gp10 family phage protein
MADIEIIFDVKGLDELEETLKEGGRKAALKFLRSVEKQAALPVLEAMQETVPIGLTGDLLVSLGIQSKTSGDQLTIGVGASRDENYIGRFAEFGTVHQPAQHWMSRAWEASKDTAFDGFIQAATEALNEMKHD